MVRLSFITDEATQNFEEAIWLAKANRLDGLELRSVENSGIEEIPDTVRKVWKRRLDEEGLVVSNIAGSFLKCEYSMECMESELDKLRRLCDAADAFSCRTIRGFCFLAPKEGVIEPERLAPCFERAAQILRKRGKRLLLEADPSVNTSNHRGLAKLLKLLDPMLFGAIYDPGNDLFDPLGEKPFPEGYEAVRPYLAHIHIKDAVYDKNLEPVCVAPGKGLVGYGELLKKLEEDGYDGWFSLEPHYRKDIELTKEQMLLPGGSDFSRGGIASLEECAAALKSLLENVQENGERIMPGKETELRRKERA